MTERRNRFVERVREATRALIEDLLESNRRLRLAVDVIGHDREDLTRQLGPQSSDALRFQAGQAHVLELMEATEREYEQFEAQFVEIERQNSSLATLYAAGHALHASIEREAVVGAIQEVVINLIGSEEFAIVSADDLTPIALFGVRPDRLRNISPNGGIVARALSGGRPLALPRGVPVDGSGVRVCIPLRVGERPIAAVLIFGFLPQKSELTPLDYELFSLVGSHAATALYCAELHAGKAPS
ncbi:MAG TPA: hypothetical protein VF103_02025 [Polyangiaceae bacterium]|jgi:hypothetical protein